MSFEAWYELQGWDLVLNGWGVQRRRRRRRKNFCICESIGHRPLQGRCPSHHHTTYTHIGATGTTDHLTLLRLFPFLGSGPEGVNDLSYAFTLMGNFLLLLLAIEILVFKRRFRPEGWDLGLEADFGPGD